MHFLTAAARSRCAVAAKIDCATLGVIGPSVLDKAKLQSRSVVTIKTASRQGWDHKRCEAQRWTFAALRSDGAKVRCNGAHAHASYDIPRFKPV
jgi:hypothetical protein